MTLPKAKQLEEALVLGKKECESSTRGWRFFNGPVTAACGSSDDTTTTSTSTSTTTTTTTTTPASQTITLTTGIDAGTGGAGDDTISGARVDTIQTWN